MGFRKAPEERHEIAETIMQGKDQIHAKIIARLEDPNASELNDIIHVQGFSFDVLHIEADNSDLLVELNSFGIRGACGSCLFHWIKDRGVLYGKDGIVKFRVAI